MPQIRMSIVVVTLLLAACAVTGFFLLKPRTPSSDYAIPRAELSAVEASANSGNLAASKRLVDFYLISESDEQSALPWLRLATKQGDSESSRLLIDILSRSKSEADQQEAKSLASRQFGPHQP